VIAAPSDIGIHKPLPFQAKLAAKCNGVQDGVALKIK
jgi:hypothetical protein